MVKILLLLLSLITFGCNSLPTAPDKTEELNRTVEFMVEEISSADSTAITSCPQKHGDCLTLKTNGKTIYYSYHDITDSYSVWYKPIILQRQEFEGERAVMMDSQMRPWDDLFTTVADGLISVEFKENPNSLVIVLEGESYTKNIIIVKDRTET